MKKYFAELVGTFALALIVRLSLNGTLPISTPVLAGLTLGLFVYTIAHISGTHINPAVTLGAWAIGKIKSMDVLGYLIAQFVGAGLAILVAKNMVGTLPVLPVENTIAIGVAEALGALFFGFGIAAVVYKKVQETASGLVIGSSLLFGILIAAGLGSLGVLNPAVGLAIGAFNISYILGPIIGVAAGMFLYKYLAGE